MWSNSSIRQWKKVRLVLMDVWYFFRNELSLIWIFISWGMLSECSQRICFPLGSYLMSLCGNTVFMVRFLHVLFFRFIKVKSVPVFHPSTCFPGLSLSGSWLRKACPDVSLPSVAFSSLSLGPESFPSQRNFTIPSVCSGSPPRSPTKWMCP